MWLITGSDQEHIGRVSLERTAGEGILSGIWDSDCDEEPLPWRIRWDRDRADTVDGGED